MSVQNFMFFRTFFLYLSLVVMLITCYDYWSLLTGVCHVCKSCQCIFTRGCPWCLQVKLGWVGLGCVRLAHAQMVISSGVLTSHLTISSKRHVGDTECRKFNFIIWVIYVWHDVYTIFYEFKTILSVVIKYVHSDIPS
jgi:hypothetical protein